MKPVEFLRLAEHLAAGNTEAEWRSAVSRAYYGAFHEAQLLLERCGVQLRSGMESHLKVAYCLQNSTDKAVARAGTKLAALRRVRNDADYQLITARFDALLAIAQVVDCKEIAQTFRAADPAIVRVGMREYARDILRLIVSN